MPAHSRARALVLSLLLPVVAACADTGGRPIADRASGEIDPVATTTVLVVNNNWSTIVAHAVVDGRSHRLGQVETGSRSTFTLPADVSLAPEIEVVVDPIAADADYATGPIQVSPGDRVEVNVENNLALSSFKVWAMP